MESLARHAVVAELCGNLSRMVSRAGRSRNVFVDHWPLRKLDRELRPSRDNRARSMRLNTSQKLLLEMGLLKLVKGGNLRIKASEDALDRGVFLEFNPTAEVFEETPVHTALRDLIEDVESLTWGDDGRWRDELFRLLWATPGDVNVPQHYIVMALAYYRQMENVFNSHVALVRALVSGTRDVQQVPRLPTSPYGERVQWEIAAERVPPSAVRRLIESNIFPFGTRLLASEFGDPREEQEEAIKEMLKQQFKGYSGVLDEDALQRMADSALRRFAPDEEGLEELGPEPQ